MKRAFITGDKGFIARNLYEVGKDRLDFINPDVLLEGFNGYSGTPPTTAKNEIDFTNPVGIHSIKNELKKQKCNVIIHNGATVGTDVCGLYPKQAIINNVYGTYNIAMVAKELNIPIVYIGTTVIYDTKKYQDDYIAEESLIAPRTLYASTKYEGELIIRAYCQESKYCILRPLFCYGGEGDMNSLITKAIFNDVSGRKKPFKIFLDPGKIKDYMHVDDFCEAIVVAATNNYILKFNTDFNISADNPIPTYEILEKIEKISEIDTRYIQWVPETDYLGNHRIDNSKFKIVTSKIGRWRPKIDLDEGISRVNCELRELFNSKLQQGCYRDSYHTYNPFEHLDKIEKEEINIETHYNFKG